jgi:6-phosphogluconolactonase (cycloisomerase 2 family)
LGSDEEAKLLTQRFLPIRAFAPLALIALIAGLALAPGASAASKKKKPKAAGYIYTQSNDPSANSVYIFQRDKKGKLKQTKTIKTGGKGTTQDVGCGPGCPILDSQGAVDAVGKLVFVVNGGSDTVTSFKQAGNGTLKRVDTETSGGDLPNSVVARDGLLYVLNTTSGNIYGLRYTSAGKLSPIAGSSQPITGQGQNDIFPSGGARQIGFDNSGDQVVVTELATVGAGGPPPGLITSFKLNSNGTTGPAVSTKSQTPLPFGFAFNDDNTLVVSEVNDPNGAADGSTSSYSYNAGTGVPTAVPPPLTSGGALPCWVSLTPDGDHAFVINTGAGRPAGAAKYDVASNGALTSKGVTEAPAGTFLWTDPAQSSDGKFLYVLAPTGPMKTKKSRIDSYKVSGSGGLTFLASTKANMPAGVSGLDGR